MNDQDRMPLGTSTLASETNGDTTREKKIQELLANGTLQEIRDKIAETNAFLNSDTIAQETKDRIKAKGGEYNQLLAREKELSDESNSSKQASQVSSSEGPKRVGREKYTESDKVPYVELAGFPSPVMPDPVAAPVEFVVGNEQGSRLDPFWEISFSYQVSSDFGVTLQEGDLIPGTDERFSKPRFERIYSYEGLEIYESLSRELVSILNQLDDINPNLTDATNTSDEANAERAKKSELIGQLEILIDRRNLISRIETTSNSLGFDLDTPEIKDLTNRLYEIFSSYSYVRETLREQYSSCSKDIIDTYVETDHTNKMMRDLLGGLAPQIYGRGATLQDIKQMSEGEINPNNQGRGKQGALIIQGPPGSGKNFIVEYFAAKTNRRLYRYVCSATKEETDLSVTLTVTGEGIVQIPSYIVQAISTPNSVLMIDEINLLKPDVAKFLNSLLDSDRTIYINNRKFKAAPGVVIVGLMNPIGGGSEGVNVYPDTLADRSSVIQFDYPELGELEQKPDEALILRKSINGLAGLDKNEFVALWNKIINKDSSITRTPDLETQTKIQDLHSFLKYAKSSRIEKNSSLHMSTRELQNIIYIYNYNMLWDTAHLERFKKDNMQLIQDLDLKVNLPVKLAIAAHFIPLLPAVSRSSSTYQKAVTELKALLASTT